MIRDVHHRVPLRNAGLALALASLVLVALRPMHSQAQPGAASGSQSVPNMDQTITPLMPQGAQFGPLVPGLAGNATWQVGQAVTSVVSPDHNTLLILTSGFNRLFNADVVPPGGATAQYNMAESSEYVFVYDISASTPIQKQPPVQVPITYHGMVFDPSGTRFYVSGCTTDNVHVITQAAAGWTESPANPPLALAHTLGNGLNLKPNGATAINSQVGVYPCSAGLAISSDGQTLVVANYYNDSITVFSGGYPFRSRRELDLRPGKTNPALAGVPGGEYPFWVAVKGTGANTTAYVSSIRDREIVVANISGIPSVVARIPVKGQPNKMTLNAAQSLLYVAEDQTDTVDVIDTTRNVILETIDSVTPLLPAALANYRGANTNSVTLSADEKQLYVTNGNLNCISVIALSGTNSGDRVAGLIPTGWYPNSVSFSGDGNTVYVVNAKSPTGPNPNWCYGPYGPVGHKMCGLGQQYNPQTTKAGFQIFPRPDMAQLAPLTAQVALNNRFAATENAGDARIMARVHQLVKHVIFILKENRTYDQILGDLEIGNGDPALTEFGESITPNEHNLARNFVTLDNFLDTAEVSYDGWLWSTAARTPDVVEHQYPVAYSYRGLSLDSEGHNRGVNIGIPTLNARQQADPFTSSDPDVLPGPADTDAPDGPNNQLNTGFLWDGALRAGLSVRNYGFFIDTIRYSTTDFTIPVSRNPSLTGTQVAYADSASLIPYTDPFFRGFDNNLPDYYRYAEWAREFNSDYTCWNCSPNNNAGLPSLSLVRFMHDHTGNFDTAIDGVNTPELMVADNDYAVGLLIQAVANSKYANNTLIFVIEDDSQDGGDHVDSHRSVAFVAGPYIKQKVLVSTAYNTIDLIRTMEEVLGLPPMNLNDALAHPMTDIFNTTDLDNGTPTPWTFTATSSSYLYNTFLPLPPKAAGLIVPRPSHNAKYWARATRGMDFEAEDRVDPLDFNHILWKGMRGNKPYPAITGADLRQNRAELLARYRQSLKKKAAPESKTN